jgi:hypothetical protein
MAAVVAIALACAPTGALAQQPAPPAAPPQAGTTDDAVAQASAHFARGVKLYEEDDFRAAVIEFNRAYELAPNWAVLYDLGQAHYQLREYPSALRSLEKYLEQGGDGIAADRRAQVEREIGELRGRVARVTAVSNVEGADVALDDAPLGKTPVREPVVVGEGRHRLTISKAGYVATTRLMDIAGGDQVTIRLDLTPETPVPVLVRESPSYTPAIVSGAVGVAGIAVGTVFGVLAVSDKSSLSSECSAAKICPATARGDIDGLSRNGAVSTVGFGVGVAGLVLGGYFFFHERARDDSRGTQRQAGTHIAPWVGPGAGGVGGTF